MQGVGEGSRQRCSVVRMVIKGVPANITTTWEPAEMPVLGPHPRPREPDGGAGEQEGRGSASPSSWGCTRLVAWGQRVGLQSESCGDH